MVGCLPPVKRTKENRRKPARRATVPLMRQPTRRLLRLRQALNMGASKGQVASQPSDGELEAVDFGADARFGHGWLWT